MNAATGTRTVAPDVCGDANDVYVDARRHRIYVSCAAGFIDVRANPCKPAAIWVYRLQ